MSLPTFSPHINIHTADARNDKIDLVIDLGCIRLGDYPGRDVDDLKALYQAAWIHFAGPGNVANAEALIRSGHSSRLFSRGRPLRIINKERAGIGPGALFNGELHLASKASPHMDIQLEFRGYLNPSRYVAHQWPSIVPEGQSRFLGEQDKRDSLFRHTENASGKSADEFSMDGEDNWIPDKGRFAGFAGAWNDRLREYIEAVRSILEAEVQRVCDCINRSGNPVSWCRSQPVEWSGSDTSLQLVETYWEFQHEAPLQLVKSLEAELRAYGSCELVTRNYQGREERDGQLREVTEKNCRLLDAEVAPGIRLIIYAKTNGRIRFEVRHDLRE